MKQCKVCEQIKPLAHFPVCRQLTDGHRNECRACTKQYVRQWRDKNAERLWARDRQRSQQPHQRERVKQLNARWRELNRAKTHVNKTFHTALRAGLVKPQPCWMCGRAAEAHHPDYSAPLDVVWLCRSHHKQAHALA